MKTLLTIVVPIFLPAYLHAQNVGIGTDAPQAKLHIANGGSVVKALILEHAGTGSASTYYIDLGFKLRGQETFHLGVNDFPDDKSYFEVGYKNTAQMVVSNTGNVGIATTTPTHRLEVNGNVRITDNLGVGVTSPTARLDLLGTLRYRGSGFPNLPQTGALLTSIDGEGNAQWQRPVVFKTRGLPAAQSIPKNLWTKIIFKNNDMEINQGLYFDPYTSTFNAPVKGAYHFDATVNMNLKSARSIMRIVVYRNGSYLKEIQVGQNVCGVCGEEDEEFYPQLRGIKRRYYSTSGIFYLEPNDKVWLEVQQYDDEGYMYVDPAPAATWFSGSLLYRVQ